MNNDIKKRNESIINILKKNSNLWYSAHQMWDQLFNRGVICYREEIEDEMERLYSEGRVSKIEGNENNYRFLK